MNRSVIPSLVALVIAALGPVACAPVGLKGDPCDDAPCAPGLICTDEGVCDEAPPPRGTTATPRATQLRTTAATSAAVPGRTTAAGISPVR